MNMSPKYVDIEGVKIFYREAGDPKSPTVLLLHGFPTSSHQFRHLIPALADKYRILAPDLPGFGFSDAPSRDAFPYSFDRLAEIIAKFTETLDLMRYAIYVFDYGAPIGFRLALRNPERISAIITQNGNAYLEGVSAAFDPIQAYWQAPTLENRNALRGFLAAATTLFQYTAGVADPSVVEPEAYTLDQALLDRPGVADIQLDLFLDYRSNVALYPAIQKYFRTRQPKLLAVWGRNDPFFIPAGAEAFRRDLPDAEIHFVDSGHFPLESNLADVLPILRRFLSRALDGVGGELFAGVTLESAPEASRKGLAETERLFGFAPNLAVKMAADPASLEGYLLGLQAFLRTTALGALEQQVVLIAASRANGADYSTAIHAFLARHHGAPDEVVEAAVSGTPIPDRRLGALQALTSAITRQRGDVSDATLAAARAAGLGTAQVVAVAFGVSLKSFASAVALIARPKIDPAFLRVEPTTMTA